MREEGGDTYQVPSTKSLQGTLNRRYVAAAPVCEVSFRNLRVTKSPFVLEVWIMP